LRAAPFGLELADGVRQRVLLARQPLDEVAPERLAAVLHPQERVAEPAPVAARQLPGHDAVAREQQVRPRLVALLRRHRVLGGEHAPASAGGERRAGRPIAPSVPSRRRGLGTAPDRLEAVRRDEPGPEELPERGEDRGAVERDAARDLLDERRPPHLELSQDSLLVLGERRLGGRFSEPPEVVPERDADAARAALERRPDEVAREAELVEPRGLVPFETRRQQFLLPELHREILALEGLERREQAGGPGGGGAAREPPAGRRAGGAGAGRPRGGLQGARGGGGAGRGGRRRGGGRAGGAAAGAGGDGGDAAPGAEGVEHRFEVTVR